MTRVQIMFDQKGKITKESFRDECDINTIMSRYEKKGILPSSLKENPIYGDFATVNNYQEALNVVIKAQEQFETLPNAVRTRFGNNPEEFLRFVNDPKNEKELIKMGLANEKPLPGTGTDKTEDGKSESKKDGEK